MQQITKTEQSQWGFRYVGTWRRLSGGGRNETVRVFWMPFAPNSFCRRGTRSLGSWLRSPLTYQSSANKHSRKTSPYSNTVKDWSAPPSIPFYSTLIMKKCSVDRARSLRSRFRFHPSVSYLLPVAQRIECLGSISCSEYVQSRRHADAAIMLIVSDSQSYKKDLMTAIAASSSPRNRLVVSSVVARCRSYPRDRNSRETESGWDQTDLIRSG